MRFDVAVWREAIRGFAGRSLQIATAARTQTDLRGGAVVLRIEPIDSSLSRRHLRFVLAWDGLAGDVEVLSRMNGPVFEHARTPDGFQAAQLDIESSTVTWPGGADLAPDTLYERVKTGAWPLRGSRRSRRANRTVTAATRE